MTDSRREKESAFDKGYEGFMGVLSAIMTIVWRIVGLIIFAALMLVLSGVIVAVIVKIWLAP